MIQKISPEDAGDPDTPAIMFTNDAALIATDPDQDAVVLAPEIVTAAAGGVDPRGGLGDDDVFGQGGTAYILRRPPGHWPTAAEKRAEASGGPGPARADSEGLHARIPDASHAHLLSTESQIKPTRR